MADDQQDQSNDTPTGNGAIPPIASEPAPRRRRRLPGAPNGGGGAEPAGSENAAVAPGNGNGTASDADNFDLD